METKKRLGVAEKFAYGIGAVGKDMVYMLSASYVLYYFQDIMGVNTIAMGIILLVARIFDAFNDPIMGVIVAKTKTKWGKFRPWLLIGTITNAVILVLMFAAPPSLDGKGLVAYAAVTYIMWGVTYTMMDIPYWSMIPAFTNAGKEREGLSALARSCAGVGSALITIITVMVVTALGTFFTSNNADTITKTFDNSNKQYTANVIKLDADGNPTDNVIEFGSDKVVASIDISGSEKTFESGLVDIKDNGVEKEVWKGILMTTAGSSSNMTYSVDVNGIELKNDDADENANKLEFVTDAVESEGTDDAGKAMVNVYVGEKTFEQLSAAPTLTIDGDLNSTQEIERVGYKYFSIIIAALFIIFIVVTCAVIKEKSSVDMEAASIKDMFKALVQNDQAMIIVLAIVLINTATYITSNLLIYFFKYDLAGSNWQGNYTLFNTFAGAMQIIAMMLFFPLLRKAFNTLKIFYICVFSAIVGYIVLLVMAVAGVTNVYIFFIPGFFIMSAVGIMNVIVTVFLANTVDYGELKNNRRDESVIFSMQTFVVKLASGIAALVATICLAVFNIQEDSSVLNYSSVSSKVLDLKNNVISTIGASDVLGLRIVMTLVPVLVLIIALILFKLKYKLTDEKLDEINSELEARHAGDNNANANLNV